MEHSLSCREYVSIARGPDYRASIVCMVVGWTGVEECVEEMRVLSLNKNQNLNDTNIPARAKRVESQDS